MCTLIHNTLDAYQIALPPSCNLAKAVCVKIVCGTNSYVFVNVYRLPGYSDSSKEYWDTLITCLYFICSTSITYTVIFVGDFNLPNVDWANGCAPNDGIQLNLCNFLVITVL